MQNYAHMSKAELIDLVQHLEADRDSVRSGTEADSDSDPERKVADTALTDSAERLRAILETAVEGIITIDERGLMETVNPAVEKLFGYGAGELIGRNVSMLMPAPYREEHDGYLDNYRRSGHAKIIGIGREVSARRKDGSVFPIDLSVSEVRLANRRLFTGFIRDITPRRDSEAQLKLLSEALESAANGIAITDKDGKILWVNPAFTALTGYTRDEAVGRNTRILKSGKHPAELYRQLWETIERGEPWHGEMLNRRKNGTLYPEEMTITPVRTGGGTITHFVAVKQDITARKEAEEKLASLARSLAEKNKELEAIVYVASHDLRSPLVNIQGFSKELAQACAQIQKLLQAETQKGSKGEVNRLLREDVPESLEYIQAGVAKIDALLAGFLRYSRLGRAALRIEPLPMNAMLASIAQAMDFQIKQADAKLQIGPLPDCLGDDTQINQVFSNLLDNAVKYLDPNRPGVITVSGQVQEGCAVYSVRDNGIGIPRPHQGKIFEIFHRLNPSQGLGEGLGLTIAQRILERHNGSIRVESEPGQGSAFFVSLPEAAKAK
ncbi:MAG TPA: PAS domain S-box protein [Verrucomicrobiae bacterium]|nr:PAS domain S-box protein [Verrucomicrobiae bacterium]